MKQEQAATSAAPEDGRMITLTLPEKTVERIILALQVMATEPTEPEYERKAYADALHTFGEAIRA